MKSASQTIDQNGLYTWGSTAGMVADVQSWLDDPGSNFGWIILGDEGTSLPTAKRFDSRETAATGPFLTVDFTTGGGQYYGGSNSAAELVPGVWGLLAGDADGDGAVLGLDASIHQTMPCSFICIC